MKIIESNDILYYIKQKKLTHEDKNTLNQLIKTNPDLIDWENEYRESLLHYSVYYKNVDAVRLLIELGAKTDSMDADYETPVYIAAKQGYIEIVKLLIKNGAGVNTKNIMGYTPLHIAIEYNYSSIAKLLIKNGADVNAQNIKKETPLHIALKVDSNNITDAIIVSGKFDFDLLSRRSIESYISNNKYISDYIFAFLLLRAYKNEHKKQIQKKLYTEQTKQEKEIETINSDIELESESERELMGFYDKSIN